jgi:biopolymer transport protein ExbD/biopolymer transport protein TolR
MSRPRPRNEIQADINVTPLVDVVLVLLIIFMVVTPMITEGAPVELPRTVHHDRKPDEGQDIIVSVTRESRVYLAANPIALEDIPRLIEEERRGAPGKLVYVKGDVQVPYGVLRQVMEALHKARIDDVTLATDARKDP